MITKFYKKTSFIKYLILKRKTAPFSKELSELVGVTRLELVTKCLFPLKTLIFNHFEL